MGLLLTIAILTSFYLTPVVIRLAWKHDAVSRPDGFRKKHSRPTPEWGGLAVNASILLGIGLSCLLMPVESGTTPFLGALALSVVVLCLIGCYDDLFDMRAGAKLIGQLVAILPLIAVGAYAERLTLFGQSIELGWLGIPWTMAWIVLGINALNLIDGMDGLASTVGIAVASAVAIVALATGNTQTAAIAIVLAGALGGFLAHNLPPARIYLGDCGSMVIGLLLATLALRVTSTPGSVSLMAVAAFLFLPLYDTALAVVRRGLSGKGVMAADRGHIHHRLLDRGLGVWKALALLAGLSLVAGAAGCYALLSGQDLWACGALIGMAVLAAQFELFGHREWAMVRDRFGWSGGREHAARYATPTKGQRTRKVALKITSDSPSRTKRLDGLPQTQTSLQMGINVRLAGAESVSTATAGKKYVELLG